MLVLCPSITMERLTLDNFMTLIRVERDLVHGQFIIGEWRGHLVISIKSDKDPKSAPHAFIGVLAS